MTNESRIKAMFSASPEQLAAVDKALTGGGAQKESMDRIIRRGEVAKVLGRSTRAVDYLVAQKILPKIVFPGRSRGGGFRLSDVQALICAR
jgi:hypothetical protein